MLLQYFGSKVVVLILLLMASICLYTEVTLSNVNIDLSDECYHLTRFLFPEEVSATIIRDHLYSSYLFRSMNNKISLLRISNIFFLVTSCAIFCYGFGSYFLNLSLNFFKGFKLYSILVLTAIIIQFPSLWIERVPAYNNISSFISLLTFGIFFRSLNPDFKKITLAYFLIGFLSTFVFIIKPPSYFILISFFFVINLFFFKSILIKLTYLVIGSLFCLLFHFIFIEDITGYLNSTRLGFSFSNFTGHTDYKSLLLENLHQLFVTIKFSVLYNKLIYFFFIPILLFSGNIINNKKILLIFIFSFGIISLRHFQIGDIDGGLSLYWYQWRFYSAQLFFSILFIFLILIKNNISIFISFEPRIIICLISLLMPILLSIGTNNIIMFNMNFYSIIFIFCFVFILSFFTDLLNQSAKKSYFILLLFLFCIGPFHSHLHGRLCENFYGLLTKSNAYNSTQPIKIYNDTIYVKKDLGIICDTVTKIVEEKKPYLKYLLNFTGSPGFNFISNLPHPIQPWSLTSSDNFTLANIDDDLFSSSAIMLLPSRKQTFDGLNEYFPEWRKTHPIKKSISITTQDQDFKYDLYFPIFD
jgi:hypothetical protein